MDVASGPSLLKGVRAARLVVRPPLQRWPYFCRRCLALGVLPVLFAVGPLLSFLRRVTSARRIIAAVNSFITSVASRNEARRIWYIGTTPRFEAPPVYGHASRFHSITRPSTCYLLSIKTFHQLNRPSGHGAPRPVSRVKPHRHPRAICPKAPPWLHAPAPPHRW